MRIWSVFIAMALVACGGGGSTGPGEDTGGGTAADVATETTAAEVTPAEDAAEDTEPEVLGYPEGPYGTRVGDRIQDLHFTDCPGEPVSLSDFYGSAEVIWLTLHAGWCATCDGQHEDLKRFHESYADRGLVILLVYGEDDFDGSGRVPVRFCEGVVEEEGFAFPVLRDEQFDGTRGFTGPGLPGQVILDRDMVIRWKSNGWTAEDAETVDATLATVLE